jgi:hypothetical protein
MTKAELDAIGALSPRAVVGYLESRGWERRSGYGSYGAIFGRSIEGHGQELLISTSNFDLAGDRRLRQSNVSVRG